MVLHRAVVLLLLTHLLSVTANTYTDKGPFSYDRLKWKHSVPSGQNDDDMHMLAFTITYPLAATSLEASTDISYPLIFFLSGFEMRASYYAPYVHHLASWGYIVVQYDVPLLPILTDRAHVEFFPHILTWVKQQLRSVGLKNIAAEAVGIVGHSRGGKLASLIATEHSDIKSLFLIDPVNGDDRIDLGSLDYPCALKALAGKDVKMAIAGSSVSGSCNPVDYDYRHFWQAAGGGSWLSIIAQAGHVQFLAAPPAQQWILNKLCKKGKSTSQDVIKRTYPSLVAWFELSFRPTQANDEEGGMTRMDEFFLWVESEKRSGELSFFVKKEVIEF